MAWYMYLKLIVEFFLRLHWSVWPVLTNGTSSFNTTVIFCFVLLIPQPKVLDYGSKNFLMGCVNCTVWPPRSTTLPPPPPQFHAGWNFVFHWFKKYMYTRTLYPVSVIYMYTNLQIIQIKKLWREQIHWLGVGKRLIEYKKQICMCLKNIQIYVARD